MLYLRGWVSTFDDLDILIDERDYERVETVMNRLGKRVIVPPNPLYETRHFLNYRIGDVKCDIMAGLSIIHQGKPHYFPYDENKYDLVKYQGRLYRLGTSDDWCEYYRLMNRNDKGKLIKNHRKERS